MNASTSAPVAELTRSRDGDSGARIAAQLREEILRGDMVPGARIRQEEVAARFGASRVPVREALSILMHEGLVTVVANSGAWVSRLTLAECEEVYQMRERLEPLLLRYSAPRLSEGDLDELSGIAARIRDSAEDVDAFLQLDRQFHLGTYAHAETQQLGVVISKLWNTTAPYRRAFVSSWTPELRRIANDEHHILIAALRDGDVFEAERVLAGHIRRTRRQLSRHPELFGPAPTSKN